MRRLFVLTTFALCVSALRADSPALTINQKLLPSPAPVGATSPQFIHSPEGLILTWKETPSAGPIAHNSASWDHRSSHWSSSIAISPEIPLARPAPVVRFPDGSQLSAFFPEKDGRILDLHTQRHRGETTASAKPLNSDSWSGPATATKPEPPLLASHEARALAVWLNYAEKNPRLFAALSITAGEQFFLPVRIDDGRPIGRASAVLLRDGSAYIIWLEAHGSEKTAAALWLRRLSPVGDPSVPVLIATVPSADAIGHPQLALLKDYDATPAQLLIAHELTTASASQLVTRLIALPSAESFLQGRPCLTCPPDTATLPGHPIKGHVISRDLINGTALIQHAEIPGILLAGKNNFHLDVKTPLLNGTHFLARAEQREGSWHLFNITILATPSSP